ncbi:MAG: c-type cytochrome [Myxococcota bacterium]
MQRAWSGTRWAFIAAILAVGCGGGTAPPAEGDVLARYEGPIRSDDVALGEQVMKRVCRGCHDGSGATPVLEGLGATPGQVRMQVREGIGKMPAIGERKVSDPELEALLAFMVTIDGVRPAEPVEPGEPAPVDDNAAGEMGDPEPAPSDPEPEPGELGEQAEDDEGELGD